ncbi:MAG: hypothetical protein AAGA86_10295 [Bacteroidota bacterium]
MRKPWMVVLMGMGFALLVACSTDNETPLEDSASENPESTDCGEEGEPYYIEANGLVSLEFEDSTPPEGWALQNDTNGVSGQGYLVWTGSPSMGSPGEGQMAFRLRISTPGEYRFLWKSAYLKGDNGTEHNDSWLRFPDAQDFYGSKGNGESRVYPKGSGKSPHPNGSSAEGWFKVYRSGNDPIFKWQANTSDHDAHQIYVLFETPGIYTLEVSPRSDYHGIDQLLLFTETRYTENEAIATADTLSEKGSCLD